MNTNTITLQREQFTQYLKNEAKSTDTIKSYVADITQFFNWLNGNEINKDLSISPSTEITRENILHYKEYMNSIGNSAETFNRKIASLTKYNNYLIYTKQQSNNFVIGKDMIKIQKQNISPTDITTEQVNKFIDKIKSKECTRNYTIVFLLANTGIRISECLDIKINDINFEKCELTVCRGKGNKQRDIPIYDHVIDVLKKYLEIRITTSKYASKSPYLFVSEHGEKLTSKPIQDMFNKHSKILTPHKLRHNFASYIAENPEKTELSITDLQYIMGHSSISTTQKYTHPRKETIRNKMSNVCFGM